MSKEKKKKLTLKNFKGTPRKFNDSSTKSSGKVVVERKNNNFKKSSKPSFQKKPFAKPFAPKITLPTEEKQKNAKEWAKKKIQEELHKGKKKSEKKTDAKRRNYKLTLSRALSDDDTLERQRSYASVKRAREKQIKKTDDVEEELQKITRDVNIPNVITIQELANRMAEKSSSIIKFLLSKNVKVTVNHSIDADTAEFIVGEFGHNAIRGDVKEDEIKKIVDSQKDQKGKEYEYLHVEHGIFETSPYVTVKELDSNKKFTCHFYRFYDDKEFLESEYKKLKEKTPFTTI